MALRTPYTTFEHKYFYSMVDKDDPESIDDLYASNIENWLIRNEGELHMRPGLTAKGTSPSATNLGAGVLYAVNGGKYLVRVINGAGNSSKFQYSTDGSTWSDASGGGSLATDKRWVFVQANYKLYGVNGTDTPIKFDGSTVSTVAGIPNGTAIEWFKNYLWVTGVDGAWDVLYFSNANDPETFGGSDFVNINLGDASRCVGLKGQAGQTGRLYIGKERSVWYLTGTDSTDFAVQPLTYEHGVASHESMVQVGQSVWCVDNQGYIRDLYRTNEDNPFSRLASEDIPNLIAGLNQVSISNASAIYFNQYIMFFVPYGVDAYNSICLVYDTLANRKNGGWVKFTNWNIARSVVFQQSEPTLYLFDSRSGNGQPYTWSGTSDNGLSITAKYETKIYSHKVPERKKKWRFAYQFAPVLGTVPVKFYVSIDRFYYQLLKTFNLSGTGDALWGVAQWGVDKWGSAGQVQERIRYSDGGGITHGYTQQVKLEAESTTTQVKLRKFTSHYRILGLR